MSRMLLVLGTISVLVLGCGAASSPGASRSPASDPTSAARTDLAPTGRLRLGFPAVPPFLGQQDPASGQWRGLAIMLGNAMAVRLGVALEPTRFPDPGATYQALRSGNVDVVFAPLQAKPDAATGSEAIVRLEHTFLVRSGSPLTSVSDVDRDGIKVGAIQGSPHTAFLASHLQHAQLEQFASDQEGLAALTAGRIDAYADSRAALVGMATHVPGSSILSGSFFTPGFGLVIMSTRARGAAYLDSFVPSVLTGGDVRYEVNLLGTPGLLVGPAA